MIPDFDQALIERHMANYSDGWWGWWAGCGGRGILKVFQELTQVPRCVDSCSYACFAPWKMLEGQKYTFNILARDIMQNNRSFWYHFGRWSADHNSLIPLLRCNIDPIDSWYIGSSGRCSLYERDYLCGTNAEAKGSLSTNPSFSKAPGFTQSNLTN